MSEQHTLPDNDFDCQVTACECGNLTLRVGRIRVEFSPEEFMQLQRLLALASLRFDVAGRAIAPMPGDRMH